MHGRRTAGVYRPCVRREKLPYSNTGTVMTSASEPIQDDMFGA